MLSARADPAYANRPAASFTVAQLVSVMCVCGGVLLLSAA